MGEVKPDEPRTGADGIWGLNICVRGWILRFSHSRVCRDRVQFFTRLAPGEVASQDNSSKLRVEFQEYSSSVPCLSPWARASQGSRGPFLLFFCVGLFYYYLFKGEVLKNVWAPFFGVERETTLFPGDMLTILMELVQGALFVIGSKETSQ